MELKDELMWQAVRSHDGQYDGLFYFGVSSTGVFCRPSCMSREPLRENVRYFGDPCLAIQAGYRPCKRCRPDLLRHEPLRELVLEVAAILEKEYAHPPAWTELAHMVGMSPFHLQRSFKKQTGRTPKEYLRAIRIEKAGELLIKNELNNTAIGYAVGYESLSGFYAAFRMETGATPREYARGRQHLKSETARRDEG